MSKLKFVSTPLGKHFKLSFNHCPKTDVKAKYMLKVSYANVVGSLVCDIVCTISYLTQVVTQVYKFMSKPGKYQWEAVN